MKWNQTPDLSDPRLMKAHVFAMAAHAAVGQRRKYSDEPYIVHPDECVAILQWLPAASNVTMEMLIAMELHDVVEDTRWFADENGKRLESPHSHIKKGHPVFLREGITFALIEQEFSFGDPAFGAEVVRILSGLTDPSMPWDGNREARKALDLAHTAEQGPDVHTNKLADVLSNAPSIIEHDPGFARKWMKEKYDLLPVLADGDPILFNLVQELTLGYVDRQHNSSAWVSSVWPQNKRP
jgi:(p)ppGpp synthase/HD superfamily hydrolase